MRILTFAAPLVLAALTSLPAAAQALRAPAAEAPPPQAPAGANAATPLRPADYIVAVVNTEPITNQQVSREVQRVRQQLAAQQRPAPDAATLERQVLEQMINERVQLQLAEQLGIKVGAPSVDQAEQMVASQNHLTVAELRRQAALEGLDPVRLRQQLHDQLVLTRLREREVDPRVRVSDADVDDYLAEQQRQAVDPAHQILTMAQLLVAVPERANAQEEAALRAKAQGLLQRARAGEDFAALVRDFSDAPDRGAGGVLGPRAGDRFPLLFLDAVRTLAPGEITGPLRSGAGFHLVKLIERRVPGLPPETVVQSHARHILLVPSRQLSETQARDKLNDFRRRILAGQADFADLARQYSQDGSAAQGGDLGWVNPGQFVPEFERVMNQLAPGQISEPLISRFGVHLVQLLERRSAKLGERERREIVRSMLREKKFAEVYRSWAQEVRARAYVELRDPPQ